jgi:hypothetical protein
MASGVDLSPYKYYVWVDSSAKGPFLPTYVQDQKVYQKGMGAGTRAV